MLDFALARVKGAIPIEPAAADLAKISRQVVAELGAAVVDQVQTEVAGDSTGHWDIDRLMQVVSNLVSNAVEHGEEGSPISLRIDGTKPNEVLFEVDNRGTIPASTLNVLFSPFKPRERHSRGLGLGLYIVDQIVRAHGGTVEVRPRTDTACFKVTLPRRAAAAAPGAPEA